MCVWEVEALVVETQSPHTGCLLPQRKSMKEEGQLSLTMDLPLTSQNSKDLIQFPGSPKAAFRETGQDM